MPAITGLEVVQDALGILNVYMTGETPSDPDAQFARRTLNDWLSELSQRPLFIPVIARERFSLVADQGGETDPYTIGVGGDFNTTRPANQNSITAANLVLTSPGPPNEVRVPLGIYTDQAYAANQIPGMESGQPTGLYYNPTYQGDLGSISLWPVPNVDTNDLELFIQKALTQFADLSTTYYVPDGVPRMLKYNLADALQGWAGREMRASDQRIAVSSVATFKRSNTKISDLMNDATWATYGRSTLYNIQTGAGG